MSTNSDFEYRGSNERITGVSFFRYREPHKITLLCDYITDDVSIFIFGLCFVDFDTTIRCVISAVVLPFTQNALLTA
jgi:hypothetical protein